MIKDVSSLEGKVLIDSDKTLYEICAVAQTSSVVESTDINGFSSMIFMDNADIEILYNSGKWKLATQSEISNRYKTV